MRKFSYSDFDYTATQEEIEEAIIDLMADEFPYSAVDTVKMSTEIRNTLRKIIKERDLMDTLIEAYEDDLNDYFYEVAKEENDEVNEHDQPLSEVENDEYWRDRL